MSRFWKSLDRTTILLAGLVVLAGLLAGFILGTRHVSTIESSQEAQPQWTLRYQLGSPSWDAIGTGTSPRYVIQNGGECVPYNQGHMWSTLWRVGGSLVVSDQDGSPLGEFTIPRQGVLANIRFGFTGDSLGGQKTVSEAEQRYGASCQIIADVPLSRPVSTYVIVFDDGTEFTYSHQELVSQGLLTFS